MARYDYRCTACGEVFEVEHAMTERPEVSCPKCGAKAEKVFTASGIKFAGSGFYTDQRGGSSSTEATSGSSDSSASTDSGASAGSSHSCENCPHKDA